MRRVFLGMLLLAGLWLATPATAATGDLTFVSCMSDRGLGCQDLAPGVSGVDTPLNSPFDIAVSPDGGAVYATGSEAVIHLFRGADGALSYDGCIGDLGNTKCTQTSGDRFEAQADVAVRPSGGGAYTTDFNKNNVSHFFTQQPGGQLIFDGCVSRDGSGGLCADIPNNGLANPGIMAFAPDGDDLYVPGLSAGSITRFSVLPAGQLVFADCISTIGAGVGCAALPAAADTALAVTITPDGESLYSSSTGGVTEFAIQPSGSLSFVGCIGNPVIRPDCRPLPSPTLNIGDIASDNGSVYVSGPNSLVHFSRDATSGALTFSECVAATSAEGCSDEPKGALDGTSRLALSPDGGSLYLTASKSDSLLEFRRRTSGRLSYAGCVGDDASHGCVDLPGTPLTEASGVTVSPDGRSVYALGREVDAISRFTREPGGPIPPLTLDIDSKSKLKLKKLAAAATCSEACSITVEADGKVRKKKFSAKPVTLNLVAGQATQIRIPLKKKLVRKLSGSKGKATIEATATAFGETATDSDKSKLK